MYTIVMNNNKELITTQKTNIYQREKLADKIQFLIPQNYNDLDLSTYLAIIKYVDQSNTSHAEVLNADEEVYKNKLRYTLPIDTEITRFAGTITIRLSFVKVNMDTKEMSVIHSGETTITVLPLKDYYTFVPDESLEFVDQLVGNLEAKIEATEHIAEIYDSEKADNLSYQDNILQLTSHGTKIGDPVAFEDNETIDDTQSIAQKEILELFDLLMKSKIKS